MDAGLNYMCMYHDASEIGYTFMDTDQNGTPEMLVGPIDSEYDYEESVVFVPCPDAHYPNPFYVG